MTNPTHSLADVVREQRRRRLQDIVVNDGLTVTQAYEAAAAFIDAQRPKDKLFPGHYTNDRGELKPTPGAIVGYDENGKPVVSPSRPTSTIADSANSDSNLPARRSIRFDRGSCGIRVFFSRELAGDMTEFTA